MDSIETNMLNPYGRKGRRTKEPLDKSERGEWKFGLKLNIQKTKIMASGPITSWPIDGETVADFIFLGFQNHCRWWLQPDKPRQHIKKRRHYFANKSLSSQSYGFSSSQYPLKDKKEVATDIIDQLSQLFKS